MIPTPRDEHRTSISSDEYEKEVAGLLQALGRDLPGFQVHHLETVSTPDGSYKIDVTARFSQLNVDFLILIECKDHARPVERKEVQVLADKLRAANAQKGMLFSTNGFRKGAIEYAKTRRIALVRLVEGELTYQTRALQLPGAPHPKPPPWANIPKYLGILISIGPEGVCTQSVVEPRRTEPLSEVVVAQPSATYRSG
ncbi:MAG: restriction endonuclease [Planctomycetota bacterium]